MYIVTKYKKILTPISLIPLGRWGLTGIETEIKDWFKWSHNKETNVECEFYDDYFMPSSWTYIPSYMNLWEKLESMFGVHNSYVSKIGLFNIDDEQTLVAEIKTDNNDFLYTSYWIIDRDEDNEFETTKIELDHDFNRLMLNNFNNK
mgnify:CR=1 FL=1|tara:strand:- start:22 stop:462 length:441 start_codon:yes stop_codon:yes gene_type:complete